MTVPTLRRDAARNWQLIVDTGRRFVDEGVPLRLNDVAHAASIGVATVYRHFPTPEALLETLALPRLESLAAYAGQAVTADDTWGAFGGYLAAGIEALLGDAAVQAVLAAGGHTLPRTSELLVQLHAFVGQLLDGVRATGAIRPEITQADVTRLMCGVVYAATVQPADDRTALARRYLDVVLTGMRPAR